MHPQDISEPAHTLANLRHGLAVQRRVMVALMIRQLMTKYGRSNIGFLWLVLEPMILCCGVLVVRSFISDAEEGGLPLISLLVTGYIPLTLYRHITSAGTFFLRRNGSMLYHRDITLFDCVFALFLLELGGCTIAFVVVYWSLLNLNLIGPIYDLGLMASGWLLMALLASSLMIAIAVLTEYYEAAERFIQPFQYLFLPICGFFYMVEWLPDYVQNLAWYVPTVHCYEMIRGGLFGPIVETHYAPWYPVVWSIGLLAWALPMVDKARDRIHFG
ncbi:ABC transporter permease [Lichenihabitans sp. PAMC28606]|uniref:ABC transporter permease n=1 Tax=Lichenihabitans sp. PAMC28606 TaxID=2880932 RepID=UPI001D0B0437|nr:ABC transporter permease [Lichenihabitans sp. PAMC28606]UDL93229.1 ABC transporter permease [Lichenihabitans sp. PAMC28606]